MAEPLAALRPYRVLLGSRLRAQLEYRRSFAGDVLGSVGVGLLEFAELYVVFGATSVLGGLDYRAAALVFVLANLSFCLADIVVGHVDSLPVYLREGTLDAYLLRPLPVLAQLVTSDLQLRRLGRMSVAVVVGVVALPGLDVDWTPAKVALLVVTPLAGGAVFGSLFVAAAGVQFFLVEGGEFANAFTYGSSYAASYPASLLGTPLRVVFTFVVPAAFTSYLPVLVLLGEPGPAGLPAWLGWFTPVAAALAVVAALGVWRVGLRHYTGTGS